MARTLSLLLLIGLLVAATIPGIAFAQGLAEVESKKQGQGGEKAAEEVAAVEGKKEGQEEVAAVESKKQGEGAGNIASRKLQGLAEISGVSSEEKLKAGTVEDKKKKKGGRKKVVIQDGEGFEPGGTAEDRKAKKGRKKVQEEASWGS